MQGDGCGIVSRQVGEWLDNGHCYTPRAFPRSICSILHRNVEVLAFLANEIPQFRDGNLELILSFLAIIQRSSPNYSIATTGR